MLAAHAFGFERGFYLPAGISGIKFMHDIPKWKKIVLALRCVYAVIYRD